MDFNVKCTQILERENDATVSFGLENRNNTPQVNLGNLSLIYGADDQIDFEPGKTYNLSLKKSSAKASK